MTTDITNTEIIVTKSDAELFADSILSVEGGLEETKRKLIRLYDENQSRYVRIDQMQDSIWQVRNSKEEIISTIKEFIVEHVKDEEDADVDSLKSLAKRLDIELTKTVKVTFRVDYEIEIECDLDAEIEDHDFETSLTYTGVGEMSIEQEDLLDFEIDEDTY